MSSRSPFAIRTAGLLALILLELGYGLSRSDKIRVRIPKRRRSGYWAAKLTFAMILLGLLALVIWVMIAIISDGLTFNFSGI